MVVLYIPSSGRLQCPQPEWWRKLLFFWWLYLFLCRPAYHARASARGSAIFFAAVIGGLQENRRRYPWQAVERRARFGVLGTFGRQGTLSCRSGAVGAMDSPGGDCVLRPLFPAGAWRVIYLRAAMSNNKAQILKAVGAGNEAKATKLLADLDTGIGKTPTRSRSPLDSKLP